MSRDGEKVYFQRRLPKNLRRKHHFLNHNTVQDQTFFFTFYAPMISATLNSPKTIQNSAIWGSYFGRNEKSFLQMIPKETVNSLLILPVPSVPIQPFVNFYVQKRQITLNKKREDIKCLNKFLSGNIQQAGKI